MPRNRSARVVRVVRTRRPRPARPSLDLVPDLALTLFARLDAARALPPRRPAQGAGPVTEGADRDHAGSPRPAL